MSKSLGGKGHKPGKGLVGGLLTHEPYMALLGESANEDASVDGHPAIEPSSHKDLYKQDKAKRTHERKESHKDGIHQEMSHATKEWVAGRMSTKKHTQVHQRGKRALKEHSK